MWPFSGKAKKKQRNWGAVCSLAGLLVAAIGFATQIWVTGIGAVLFIVGIFYLIDVLD